MLRFFSRRPRPTRELVVLPAPAASPAVAVEPCALSACATGARATVVELCCGDQEACRLRAIGLCEGAHVDIVDARRAMLLEVRGTRIALGPALTAGITVQPIAS